MNLLHDLTKKLRPLAEEGEFLLAVSGGLDSMALLQVFLHFKKHFGFRFSVAHFHHGPSDSLVQQTFREQAFEFVKRECEQNDISFLSNGNQDWLSFYKNFGKPLHSEADCRDARYQFFEHLREEKGFAFLVLAHHEDDLLETRMMRLIRGTGAEGLKAMSFRESWLLRPFLQVNRKTLSEFLRLKDCEFLEDPSNSETKVLRNWLRLEWFPSLESRVPGGLGALARSLDHLVSSLDQSVDLDFQFENDCLELTDWLPLSESKKRQVLAAYMKSQGLKNYGVSHINEVLKRLDREEKRHTFQLLGRRWKVDAGRMSLELPS